MGLRCHCWASVWGMARRGAQPGALTLLLACAAPEAALCFGDSVCVCVRQRERGVSSRRSLRKSPVGIQIYDHFTNSVLCPYVPLSKHPCQPEWWSSSLANTLYSVKSSL